MPLQPKKTHNGMSKGLGLGLEGGKTHMRKPSRKLGQPALVLESNIERLSWGLRDSNKPDPIVTAVATHGADVWTDNQGPQVGLNRRGG